MKVFSAFLSLLAATTLSLQAGQPVTYSKEIKEMKTMAPEPCYRAGEWQLDVFGQYNIGNGATHVGAFRDHSFGGGVGINYFFTEHFGIGAEYSAAYTKESPDTDFGLDRGNHTTVHGVGGSLFFRWPIESSCWAPYVYVGGGALLADREWASAHAGVGLEYRIVPGKVGIFVDGRWTYLGDRAFLDHEVTRGDLSFSSARVGVRWIF